MYFGLTWFCCRWLPHGDCYVIIAYFDWLLPWFSGFGVRFGCGFWCMCVCFWVGLIHLIYFALMHLLIVFCWVWMYVCVDCWFGFSVLLLWYICLLVDFVDLTFWLDCCGCGCCVLYLFVVLLFIICFWFVILILVYLRCAVWFAILLFVLRFVLLLSVVDLLWLWLVYFCVGLQYLIGGYWLLLGVWAWLTVVCFLICWRFMFEFSIAVVGLLCVIAH